MRVGYFERADKRIPRVEIESTSKDPKAGKTAWLDGVAMEYLMLQGYKSYEWLAAMYTV